MGIFQFHSPHAEREHKLSYGAVLNIKPIQPKHTPTPDAAGPAKEQLSLKMARKEKLLEFFAILYILSYFTLFNNKFIRVGHAPLKVIARFHYLSVLFVN